MGSILDQISPPTVMDPSQGPTGGSTDKPVKSTSLLDHLAFALLGTPDAGLAPADLKQRNQRRSEVANQSAQMANTKQPGMEFMQAPGASGGGGGSGGLNLGDIIKFVSAVL